MTSNVVIVRGVIAERHGLSPGPRTGITYDIDARMPDGGIMRWFNQVPSPRRTRAVDIEGLERGDEVWGFLDGDPTNGSAYISWQFQELIYWGECGGNQPPPGMLPLIEDGGVGIAGMLGPGPGPGGPATGPGGPGGGIAPGPGGGVPA